MDVFIEKIVTKRKDMQDYLVMAGILLGGILLAFTIFAVPFLSGFAPILAVGAIYGIYYFIKSLNIEFEYSVTNGELDVDKIIAQRKRKRIFSAGCKDFELVAKIQSQHFTADVQNIRKKIAAVSTMDSPDAFFIVLNYQGERTVVYCELDQRMLDNFKTYIPRKVME